MIDSFEFTDRESKWHLKPASFGAINLLVGISGVGKSRTLQALGRVARCGAGIGSAPASAQWTLQMNASGKTFEWSVETGGAENERSGFTIDSELFVVHESTSARKTKFLTERLVSQKGDVIASRNGDEVKLNNEPAPKLKETESLISLFRKEELIAPLYEDLSHVFTSSVAEFEFPYWPRKLVKSWLKEITSLEQLRQTMNIPLLVRFFLLQTLSPPDYENIVTSFTEIFETVNSVRVGWTRELFKDDIDDDDSNTLAVIVEEEGVPKPIRLQELSSGMRRTLRHLVELALAPSGSTILIDEYENSLGVNCLPSITKHLLNRTRDVQLIATSHHPYVVNNIDLKHWRVVARHGSDVEIVEASTIPELQTASRQDAFVRLMSSETYRRGVSAT